MRIIFVIIAIYTSVSVWAQSFDSTAIGVVGTEQNSYFDTVLNIQNQFFFNEYQRDDFGWLSMGNQGDVRRRLIPIFTICASPKSGLGEYFKNFEFASELPYYNVAVPTSEMRFLFGYNKGQMFGLNTMLNPTKIVNVFIDYQRINARGRYLFQENRVDRLRFTTFFTNKPNSYFVAIALSYNKANNVEFGGISDTLSFINNTTTNRELIAVNLTQSSSKASRVSTQIDQSYSLVNAANQKLRIFHRIKYLNEWQQFLSGDSTFTKNARFDSESIRDSARFYSIRNDLGLRLIKSKSDSLWYGNIELGINHTGFAYGNGYTKISNQFMGIAADASMGKRRLEIVGRVQYNFNSNFAGTYDAQGIVNWAISKKWQLTASVKQGLAQPSLFNQRYISNNFYWNNHFVNEQLFETALSVGNEQFIVEAKMQKLDNLIYFNEFAVPAQLTSQIDLFKTSISWNLPLWGGFYLHSRLHYQTTNNETVLRMPSLIARETFYYEHNLFKNIARLQTGISWHYFSEYVSQAYMPATSQMYLQNDVAIGDFPYINFFFNFRIQYFTFYLRIENVSEGLFGHTYFAAPAYPLPDFTLRMGATWRFFN